MLPIFAEVIPPPEVIIPSGAVIEGAIGALVGALAAAIPWWRSALVGAVKWVAHLVMVPIHDLSDWVQGLNIALGAVHTWAINEVEGLVRAISVIHPSTVVQVTNTAVANLDQVYRTIDGAENYAIGVAEDLYNRAVAHTDAAAVAVSGAAAHWVDDVAAHFRAEVADVQDRVGWVFGTVESDVIQVRTDAAAAAQSALSSAIGYADDLVAPIPGWIADTRTWAQAAAALVGAEVFAKVITTVQSLYDPCCEFATDQVKPSWDKVKGMLGKLTSRGPLLLVVLGAASEVVVNFDRPAIVAALKQAKADDHGASVAVLNEWRRPGVA